MSIIVLEKKEQEKNLQSLVWIASRRYILGEISIEELTTIEEAYNLSIRRAIITLSVQKQKTFLFHFMLKNIERNVRKLFFHLFPAK